MLPLENTEKYRLSAIDIDAASEKIEEQLSLFSVDQRNILRFRLMFEEILLNYRDRFGEENEFALRCEKRFFGLRIVVAVAGENFEPFSSAENGDDYSPESLRVMLANMGLAPSHRYKNGENIITLSLEKKRRASTVIWLLAAVLSAVATGLLCLHLPESARELLSVKVIEPVTGKFMGLLSAIAGPLIFLSVLWGIYSIGDVATFGRIGKRMISRFLLMSALLLMIVGFATVPFFSLSLGESNQTDFSELYQMLLDIVPSNLITPFTEGNTLQIVFIAIIFGAALLVQNDKTMAVSKLVEQLDYMVQLIMKCLNSFIPLIVFLSIFNMIIKNDSVIGSTALKPMLVNLFIIALILAIAAPPVPGGFAACNTILITQLGIPEAAIPIVIAMSVILDFPCTATNLFCLQAELTELAGNLDMLDMDVLRKAP